MNNIYLLVDEKNGYSNFKAGFTGNLFQRFIAYGTANPDAFCISTLSTYRKTGRALEKAIHAEIVERGYKWQYSRLNGSKTEWFSVPKDDPFHTELMEKGLLAFNTCKGRKECGGYDIVNKKAL